MVAPLPDPPELPRRVAFLGTPEIAVPCLRALASSDIEVALVVSRADKRRGRRSEPTPSPVKAVALELGLPVTARLDDVVDAGIELGVVVAYGRIVPRSVLEAVPMINLHFSLLPRWRGAAPVERAILAGDRETGVCLMGLEEGLDTGPVYRRSTRPIGPFTTSAGLAEALAADAAELLVDGLTDGLRDPEPQDGPVTYAEKLDAGDRHLDWSEPAEQLDRVVRIGGAWTSFRGKRLKVHAARPVEGSGPELGHLEGVRVGTGDGVLELVDVQPEGKGRMPAAAWRNGAQPGADERLGE
ncbi:MAG: methionyl-tRNA formyltransferase [Actinomycetota bacterium]